MFISAHLKSLDSDIMNMDATHIIANVREPQVCNFNVNTVFHPARSVQSQHIPPSSTLTYDRDRSSRKTYFDRA
jgi:hypothetical protein